MAKRVLNFVWTRRNSGTHIFTLTCIVLLLFRVIHAASAVDSSTVANQTRAAENLNILNTNLDVLYLVPKDLDDIFTLNEKNTFGNDYTKGWILPSEEKLSIFLYLYYEGLDERRMNLFVNQGNTFFL